MLLIDQTFVPFRHYGSKTARPAALTSSSKLVQAVAFISSAVDTLQALSCHSGIQAGRPCTQSSVSTNRARSQSHRRARRGSLCLSHYFVLSNSSKTAANWLKNRSTLTEHRTTRSIFAKWRMQTASHRSKALQKANRVLPLPNQTPSVESCLHARSRLGARDPTIERGPSQ